MNSTTKSTSLRYGGGSFDLRSALIRVIGILQRKKVVILNSDPALCGEILASSDAKGTFLEQLIAVPAWAPTYSIESMDGERWMQLSKDFKKLMHSLHWRERLLPIIKKQIDPHALMNSEAISKLTSRILFELLFDQKMSSEDELLFYQASVEWRKEIAVKGKAKKSIKKLFWSRLHSLVEASKFKDDLHSYRLDPAAFLSVFAQPFLISPQINVSDIFVSSFHFLRKSPDQFTRAKERARANDRPYLERILLESIRLKHPFPILERELKRDFSGHGVHYPTGTQVMMLMDQFKQDQTFDPDRWLKSAGENPYHALPFAAGPRMCVGKPIAMELMAELLKSFLTEFKDEQIQPELGHLYSGRNNDGKESLRETLYQIKIFVRALWKSFWMGMGKDQIANECPIKILPGLRTSTDKINQSQPSPLQEENQVSL